MKMFMSLFSLCVCVFEGTCICICLSVYIYIYLGRAGIFMLNENMHMYVSLCALLCIQRMPVLYT